MLEMPVLRFAKEEVTAPSEVARFVYAQRRLDCAIADGAKDGT